MTPLRIVLTVTTKDGGCGVDVDIHTWDVPAATRVAPLTQAVGALLGALVTEALDGGDVPALVARVRAVTAPPEHPVKMDAQWGRA